MCQLKKCHLCLTNIKKKWQYINNSKFKFFIMKKIDLLALLLKYKTNLKTLKKQLSPTLWECFKKSVNENDIERVDFWLSYCLKNS
tara:strand:+ start:200 stop:457 length:258 start_codon:yes stop_codon:yes gene_type:complete